MNWKRLLQYTPIFTFFFILILLVGIFFALPGKLNSGQENNNNLNLKINSKSDSAQSQLKFSNPSNKIPTVKFDLNYFQQDEQKNLIVEHWNYKEYAELIQKEDFTYEEFLNLINSNAIDVNTVEGMPEKIPAGIITLNKGKKAQIQIKFNRLPLTLNHVEIVNIIKIFHQFQNEIKTQGTQIDQKWINRFQNDEDAVKELSKSLNEVLGTNDHSIPDQRIVSGIINDLDKLLAKIEKTALDQKNVKNYIYNLNEILVSAKSKFSFFNINDRIDFNNIWNKNRKEYGLELANSAMNPIKSIIATLLEQINKNVSNDWTKIKDQIVKIINSLKEYLISKNSLKIRFSLEKDNLYSYKSLLYDYVFKNPTLLIEPSNKLNIKSFVKFFLDFIKYYYYLSNPTPTKIIDIYDTNLIPNLNDAQKAKMSLILFNVFKKIKFFVIFKNIEKSGFVVPEKNKIDFNEFMSSYGGSLVSLFGINEVDKLIKKQIDENIPKLSLNIPKIIPQLKKIFAYIEPIIINPEILKIKISLQLQTRILNLLNNQNIYELEQYWIKNQNSSAVGKLHFFSKNTIDNLKLRYYQYIPNTLSTENNLINLNFFDLTNFIDYNLILQRHLNAENQPEWKIVFCGYGIDRKQTKQFIQNFGSKILTLPHLAQGLQNIIWYMQKNHIAIPDELGLQLGDFETIQEKITIKNDAWNELQGNYKEKWFNQLEIQKLLYKIVIKLFDSHTLDLKKYLNYLITYLEKNQNQKVQLGIENAWILNQKNLIQKFKEPANQAKKFVKLFKLIKVLNTFFAKNWQKINDEKLDAFWSKDLYQSGSWINNGSYYYVYVKNTKPNSPNKFVKLNWRNDLWIKDYNIWNKENKIINLFIKWVDEISNPSSDNPQETLKNMRFLKFFDAWGDDYYWTTRNWDETKYQFK